MSNQFNYQPLLNFEGKKPLNSKIIKSDFTSCKATLEVIAEYQYEKGIRKFKYIFYLFNIPTHTSDSNNIWLSKFERILVKKYKTVKHASK